MEDRPLHENEIPGNIVYNIPMRKIEIVNRYFRPVSAGIETTLEQILRHIDPESYNVTVHTSADTLEQSNALPLREKYGHITVRRYHTFHKIFLPRVPYMSTDCIVITNFTLMPHIIIVLCSAVLKALRLKRFRFIFFPNGGFTPDWAGFPPHIRSVKRLVHRIAAILINYSADAVIAISDWERNKLTETAVSPRLIRMMRLGVEDEAFTIPQEPKKARDPYIVQVARIHPIKGIDATIKALARIPGLLDFVIVGGTENKTYLKTLNDLIRSLGMQNRVRFAGSVSVEEKYRIIDGALCMVHMSHNESFGLSIHEAMSRGLPVIVGDNTAQPEAVQDGINGFVVPDNDIDQLVSKIRLLTSEEGHSLRRKMGTANRQLTQSYRWKNVSAHFVDWAMGNDAR